MGEVVALYEICEADGKTVDDRLRLSSGFLGALSVS
jgi:hypothetical protein